LGPTTISRDNVKRYSKNPVAFFKEIRIPTALGVSTLGESWAPFQKDFFHAVSPALLAVTKSKRGPYRGFWLERTKGASKDSDVGLSILWLLLFSPRPLAMESGADDRSQAEEMYKAMREMVRLNPWMEKRLILRVSKVVCPNSRCELLFLTTDQRGEGQGAHGSRPDVTICNELSHVGNKGFIQTMLDNADKVPTNLRFLCTNAGVLRTWQHQWREKYKDDQRWWWQKVSEPAPWIDEEALADARFRNTTSRYLRLWSGIWTSGEGDAIDERDIKFAISNARGPMTGRESGYIFVAGLDLGVKHDHSAFAVLGCRMGTGKVRLAMLQSWKPEPKDIMKGEHVMVPKGSVNLPNIRQTVQVASHRFNLAWVGYDPYQAALMAQDLAGVGVKMHEWPFTGKSGDLMAQTVLQAFRSRALELYDDPELVSDLHRLSIAEKRYGHQKLEAISDDQGHADRAIAVAIALPTAIDVASYHMPDDVAVDDFGDYDAVTI
jgi:phage terminase large subunit-like protein